MCPLYGDSCPVRGGSILMSSLDLHKLCEDLSFVCKVTLRYSGLRPQHLDLGHKPVGCLWEGWHWVTCHPHWFTPWLLVSPQVEKRYKKHKNAMLAGVRVTMRPQARPLSDPPNIPENAQNTVQERTWKKNMPLSCPQLLLIRKQ